MLAELLSPVGNMEHLKIAVLSGASSVYLSGKLYGARQYADNFSVDEIRDAVEYAHLHNVKVYVTVNTLIKESELIDCLDYLKELYFIGVDAVLIQDIGLLQVIRKYIPGLNIHASTQMKIKNVEELRWAKESGISRVVLPRELNLKELKRITKEAHKIGLEVEIFVHGAQCYSYSGECLLSSFIGGRSGNRGTCGQPCRQAYNIEVSNQNNKKYQLNKNPEYFLSPRDLSLYDKLSILSKIGIDCIKIEGRMRSNEYVMVTTRTYRQALNHLNHKDKKEKTIQKSKEDLNLVFNRKTSTGHLFNDDTNKIINPIKPGHQGLYIGEIHDYDGNDIYIKLKENLINIPQKGDGLVIEGKLKDTNKNGYYGFDISGDPKFKKSKVYWNKNRLIKDKVEDKILIVRKVKENKKEQIKIKKHCKVYLTKQNQISKDLKQLLNNKIKPMYKKSVLNLSFYMENKNPVLKGTVRIGDGRIIKHTYRGVEPWQKAKNKPITPEVIEKQMSKIKNSPYYLEEVKVSSIEKNLFAPISELNNIRREFLKELETKIIESYSPQNIKEVKHNIKEYKNTKQKNHNHKKNTLELSIYVNDLEILKNIDDTIFKRVYFQIPPKDNNLLSENKVDISYCVNQIKEAREISEPKDFELIWMWPEILHDSLLDDFIRITGILNKTMPVPSIMTQQLGLEDYFKNKFNIDSYGTYSLNIMNTETIQNLEKFKLLTLSPEISKKDYADIINNISSSENLEVLIFGNIISMISWKNILSDKMKKKIKNLDNPDNKINKIYLSDKKGNKYPIHSTMNNNELIILNDKDYSLLDYVDYLISLGYSNFSIDLRWKNKKYIEKISKICNNLIINNNDDDVEGLVNNYTIGNFNRGLK